MNADALVAALFVLAPGFVSLKVFELSGARWKRSEWEWTIWSVIAGAFCTLVVAVFGLQVLHLADLDLTPQTSVSLEGVPERFIVSIVLGFLLLAGWRVMGTGRRRLQTSAWDVVLQEAADARSGVEATLIEGGSTERYYGSIHTFGRETEGAEPWLYIGKVKRYEASTDEWVSFGGVEGILVHKDSIAHLGIVAPSTLAGMGQRRIP
jgi:hypothetical protein